MVKILKRLGIAVICTVFFFGIVHLFDTYVASKGDFKDTIFTIKRGYKGVVKKFTSVNVNMDTTHILVNIPDSSKFDILMLPPNDVMKEIDIGDSIIKLKNDNYILVKKSNGNVKKYINILISDELRNHPDWPKEWSDKWIDATLESRRIDSLYY